MWLVPLIVRTGLGLGLTYTVVLLWTAAGLVGVTGLAMMLYGGVLVVRGRERRLPSLRAIARRLRR